MEQPTRNSIRSPYFPAIVPFNRQEITAEYNPSIPRQEKNEGERKCSFPAKIVLLQTGDGSLSSFREQLINEERKSHFFLLLPSFSSHDEETTLPSVDRWRTNVSIERDPRQLLRVVRLMKITYKDQLQADKMIPDTEFSSFCNCVST